MRIFKSKLVALLVVVGMFISAASAQVDPASIGFDSTTLDTVQTVVIAFLSVGAAIVLLMTAFRMAKKGAGQSSV